MKSNPKPTMEQDDIKGITRFKKTLFYYHSQEWNSSFIKNEQLVYKEVRDFNKEYEFYDYLKFEYRIDHIENTIYFIVDETNYPIIINSQYSERFTEIDKDEEDVMLADSSRTTVITDYEIRDYNLISIQYSLSNDLMEKIAEAVDVKIRYYAPPEMITLDLSNHKLKAFRALVDAGQEYKNPNIKLN